MTHRQTKERGRQAIQDWAGARLNKPGNLHETVLGAHKMHRSLHIPASIFSLYRGINGVQSHRYGPSSLNNTLLYKTVSLQTAPTVRTGRTYISRTGRGWRASDCLGPILWVNWQSHALNDLQQQQSRRMGHLIRSEG